jgi:hypothetical protein
MRHSPGPWKLETRAHVHAIMDANGEDVAYQHIAPTDEKTTTPEVLKGNAQLIAAAPTLLQALKLIYDLCPCTCDPTEDEHAENCPVGIAVKALNIAGV